jgi:hypothetical protein
MINQSINKHLNGTVLYKIFDILILDLTIKYSILNISFTIQYIPFNVYTSIHLDTHVNMNKMVCSQIQCILCIGQGLKINRIMWALGSVNKLEFVLTTNTIGFFCIYEQC